MANPFSQMKDIYKMQKEAKEMQKKLRERKVSGRADDESVVIYMNAAQEFEDIYVDDSLLDTSMSLEIKKRFKEAFKDYQKNLQKEMMKDFDMDQLKRLMGGN